MNYTEIVLESIVWSLLWMAMIAYSLRVYPFTLEHDYPEDVRNVANIQKPSSIERRKGMVFSVFSLILLLGLLVSFIVCAKTKTYPSSTFIFAYLDDKYELESC